MIILHHTAANSEKTVEVWLAPAHVVAFQAAGDYTEVWTSEGQSPARVDETPAQIARLKRAWSRLDEDDVIALELKDDLLIAHHADTYASEDA